MKLWARERLLARWLSSRGKKEKYPERSSPYPTVTPEVILVAMRMPIYRKEMGTKVNDCDGKEHADHEISSRQKKEHNMLLGA
jgi:hypothetical protein